MLNEDNVLEFCEHIIDVFESFLDDKGIILPNVDRDNDPDLDPEEASNIYGDDYYRLEDEIRELLIRWKLVDTVERKDEDNG